MTPLEQWLSDATRGLSAESAAQVRAEIRQHYESACETGDDAIVALGNPRTANRAYRKVLLTKQEARMAPVLTKPKRPGVSQILLAPALLAALIWIMSRKPHGLTPGFWPVLMAICWTTPLAWFFPPATLARCRIYTYIYGVRSLLIVAVAWWYYGWISGLTLGATFFLMDYLLHHQRLTIFRKLAAGQTYSLLPEEPGLTHLEAMYLRNLDKEPDSFPGKVASTLVPIMAAGMAVWVPATFVPMAVFVAAAHLTWRAVPFRTEKVSRWFRIAKWTAMVVAALLPVLYGARMPWAGAAYLVFLFLLFDMRNISLRRKLPAEQWPKRLYW